jgi:metal-responsive CopG/Arc/MetJ family transcriptional regulator
MRDELVEQLESLSAKTNRSRNELINILLREAMTIVSVEDDKASDE